MKLHFISGLPRSGSTLLAALLRQNPRLHAEMSSPVQGIVGSIISTMGLNEFSRLTSESQKLRVLRGVFQSYYHEKSVEQIIFDTNRSWCSNLPLVSSLFPEAKVIACVRNPAWIVDSFERINQKNPLQYSSVYGEDAARGTVYDRADYLLRSRNVLGFSLNALRESYYGEFASRVLLLEYDILCQRPLEALNLVYDFLDEPKFSHNFDNVEYSAESFDTMLNMPGLHRVHGPVRFEPRATCLPPELFERCASLDFWRRETNTRAFRVTQES